MSPILRDDCKCGHDRCSHHDKIYNCLSLNCECKRFRGRDEKDDEKPARPDHPSFCQCYYCKRAA